MRFRRETSSHDVWRQVVRQYAALLKELPPQALVNEQAFRGYVTNGVYRGTKLSPTVFELSPGALDDLWNFINNRAQFDMDATLFDDFNEAFKRAHE
jgi:hypothetical protein